MNIFEQVRQKGYKIYVRHCRLFYDDPNVAKRLIEEKRPFITGLDELLMSKPEAIRKGYDTKKVSPYGGKTELEIRDKDGNSVVKMKTYCSLKDHFCRKFGLKKAILKSTNQLIEAGFEV